MQANTYFEYYNFYILNFLLHVVGFIIVPHIYSISVIILQKLYIALYQMVPINSFILCR